MKFALAERNGLELPYASVEEMRAAYDFDDLPSFLAQYYEGMSVLLVEDDFYDLAMAYFTRVAAQNLVYVEMFFDPQAHTTRGIEFGTVITGAARAQTDAEQRFGIRSQLIMCFLRDMSAESRPPPWSRPASTATGSWAWASTPTRGTTRPSIPRRLRGGPGPGLPADHALRRRPGELGGPTSGSA